MLRSGARVAIVFRNETHVEKAIEGGFRGFPVVDGDADDLVFKHAPGTVIGLYAKGNTAIHDRSGFVYNLKGADLKSPLERAQEERSRFVEWTDTPIAVRLN